MKTKRYRYAGKSIRKVPLSVIGDAEARGTIGFVPGQTVIDATQKQVDELASRGIVLAAIQPEPAKAKSDTDTPTDDE